MLTVKMLEYALDAMNSNYDITLNWPEPHTMENFDKMKPWSRGRTLNGPNDEKIPMRQMAEAYCALCNIIKEIKSRPEVMVSTSILAKPRPSGKEKQQ